MLLRQEVTFSVDACVCVCVHACTHMRVYVCLCVYVKIHRPTYISQSKAGPGMSSAAMFCRSTIWTSIYSNSDSRDVA